MQNIVDIENKLNIDENYVENYGKYKAKIDSNYYSTLNNKKNGKLILVTATNPTPFGEGKTTQTIGLSMALNKLNKSSICVLREPSLGPVFGIKGGAIGGGKSTVEPQEDINLHFNGDFHAITSANNLICAAISNHIFQGNALNIDENNICIKRVIDMNDRALRNIAISNDGILKKKNINTSFELTVASELMAIFCLSNSKEELKNKLDKMIIAYSLTNTPIYLKDLKITNAVLALTKDVLSPNLVQTSENTPAIVHLGPFANIAHGCNSIIATKTALKLSDFVVTEAGFGADLGFEKFIDIKCRNNDIKPDVVVLVTSIRALKYNGKDNLNIGIFNLKRHIENIKSFNLDVVVCINKFDLDNEYDIQFVKDFCLKQDVKCVTSNCFNEGSLGVIDLANTILDILDNQTKEKDILFPYNLEDSIEEKVYKIVTKIYKGASVKYTKEAKEKISNITKLNFSNLPICIAKTPLSFSDNKDLLGTPKNFQVSVTDVRLNSGAGFITIYMGKVLTMPGLPKTPNFENF